MVLPSSEGTGGVPGAAPADGNYTLGGQQYQVRKGDPLPDGAVFVETGRAEPSPPDEADEQEATAPGKPAKGAAAKRGGTETTKAAGPAETAG